MSLDQNLFNKFNAFIKEIIQQVNFPPKKTTVRWDGVCQQTKRSKSYLDPLPETKIFFPEGVAQKQQSR